VTADTKNDDVKHYLALTEKEIKELGKGSDEGRKILEGALEKSLTSQARVWLLFAKNLVTNLGTIPNYLDVILEALRIQNENEGKYVVMPNGYKAYNY
jgi:hypothetical protein